MWDTHRGRTPGRRPASLAPAAQAAAVSPGGNESPAPGLAVNPGFEARWARFVSRLLRGCTSAADGEGAGHVRRRVVLLASLLVSLAAHAAALAALSSWSSGAQAIPPRPRQPIDVELVAA